jgi:hypothetical protein
MEVINAETPGQKQALQEFGEFISADSISYVDGERWEKYYIKKNGKSCVIEAMGYATFICDDAPMIISNKFIEIGDIVDVFFENSNAIFEAELLQIPFKQGDCFAVKRVSDGSIYYIQNFSYMRKSKNGEDNDKN